MSNNVAEKFLDDFVNARANSQFKDENGIWSIDKIFDALEANKEDPIYLVRGLTQAIKKNKEHQ